MAKSKKVVEGKIIKVKIYTIKFNYHEDGSLIVDRHCDGFTPHELLGILEETQLDIINQIRGIIPPAKMVNKTVVKNK